MAVTKGGAHVLVYLGNGEWMEADPSLNKVVIIHPPTANAWFDMPVQLVQWSQLAK